jgi:hypothetical protein
MNLILEPGTRVRVIESGQLGTVIGGWLMLTVQLDNGEIQRFANSRNISRYLAATDEPMPHQACPHCHGTGLSEEAGNLYGFCVECGGTGRKVEFSY